jgi:hypothetical protein
LNSYHALDDGECLRWSVTAELSQSLLADFTWT